MAFDEVTSQPMWSPNSGYAKLMRLWNTPVSQGGKQLDPGTPFPAMLYRAKKVDGKNLLAMPHPGRMLFKDDGAWLRACEEADKFSASCQRIVQSEEELRDAQRDGWKETPQQALAYANGLDDDIANAAAHRAYEDRNMSERAKAEAAAVEAESFEHVPEIPEQPLKRRGRPRKVAP